MYFCDECRIWKKFIYERFAKKFSKTLGNSEGGVAENWRFQEKWGNIRENSMKLFEKSGKKLLWNLYVKIREKFEANVRNNWKFEEKIRNI